MTYNVNIVGEKRIGLWLWNRDLLNEMKTSRWRQTRESVPACLFVIIDKQVQKKKRLPVPFGHEGNINK